MKETYSLLTVAEVADRLRIHPNTVYGHLADGLIPYMRVGRFIRVSSADLEKCFVALETEAKHGQ